MLSRRSFFGVSAAGIAVAGLGGCSDRSIDYREAVARMLRPLAVRPDISELVRYATLAPSGHNSQPWRFQISDQIVDILPDLARRTPVVDPDDHHLFVSLGCAAETLSLAARARGLAGEALFEPSDHGRIRVDLRPAPQHEATLFRAIPARQCSRATYDGKAASAEILERLRLATSGGGAEVLFVTEGKRIEDILALVLDGNSRQMDDPAFVTELKAWIRFNPDSALAARDGLYTAASGNPTLPSWLGPSVFELFFRKAAEHDKIAEQVRSSAGIAVFVAASDDREGWTGVGRAYQRFALRATVEGLKNAFINQAVEVPEVRGTLQSLLSLGDRRASLVVRFGWGPAMPKSLRRPVRDVLV